MYKRQALLGANGAGKTTTLRAISNLLKGERGDVTKGHIQYRDQRIEKLSPAELVKRGVVQVMEGRHCFAHLTIEENLLTGAYTRDPVSYTHLDVYKRQEFFCWRGGEFLRRTAGRRPVAGGATIAVRSVRSGLPLRHLRHSLRLFLQIPSGASTRPATPDRQRNGLIVLSLIHI